jgi:hypothetical protein
MKKTMNMYSNSRARFGSATLGFFMCVVIAAGMFGGCKKVTGTRVDNEAPLVWFANVPPEDQKFSTNPLVHWVGQDRDGQVIQFRYRVIRQTTMMAAIGQDSNSVPDAADLDAYVALLTNTSPDSVWTYLTVDPQQGQPQTGVVVPLVAELSDPVRVYVPQFVFVQAIDDRGTFSNVAHRRFVRNNNPPNTRILGFDSTLTPFIDAIVPGGVATGIKMMWSATDILDYPTEPPPFEFQWRLYGPYDSVQFKTMEQMFRRVVYVTNDAQVFIVKSGDAFHDTLEFCDTAYYAEGVAIQCDTIVVDTVTVANLHGHLDTIFNVNDPLFVNDTSYNLVADSSKNGVTGWVTNLRDSIYDAFRNRPSANTQQGRFLFWVRGRDDAKGPDVAPAFVSFTVVAPKYEHNLLVADVAISYEINPRILSRAKLYWDSVYTSWHGSSDGWLLSRDYHMVSQSSGNVLPLSLLLSHKVVIVINDDVIKGVFNTPDIRKRVFTALDAGVSVWMCGRSMIAGDEDKPPDILTPISGGWPRVDGAPGRNYAYYFGAEAYQHSGWDWFALKEPTVRIEDFIGTSSLDPDRWPDINVDTLNLRTRYGWGGDLFFPYRSDLGALPEVGYMISGFGTEVMHLYRSKYGTQLLPVPIGKSFDGRPVMHRFNRGVFRSAISLFTPYAMNDSDPNGGVGKTVDNMLEWLFFPFESGAAPGTAEFYFPEGPGAVSREEARKVHFLPIDEASTR